MIVVFPSCSCPTVLPVPVDNVHESAAMTQITRDLEFTLGKTFSTSNYVDNPDMAARRACDIVNEIDSFLPAGLQKVTDVDVYVATVSLSISQIHVIEDRDFGPGEVYLVVWLNRYYDSVYNNYGSYYVVNDDDYVATDISWTMQLASMDGWFTVEIYGEESDVEGPEFMGGELFWVDLSSLAGAGYSGWCALNYYPPVGGNNAIQIEVFLNLQFTQVQRLSYPDDFMAPYDGSYLIAAVYFPKLYYDTLDGAHSPIIEKVYQQVYYGYDQGIGSNAYCIYYMIYYPYEKDNFGALFGHYYDFEPMLFYVRNIGEEPYRIVYRDVGAYTLPPRVIIHDLYASTGTGISSFTTSVQLAPLLGNECMVEYNVRNSYWSTPAFQYETDHGLAPFMDVPLFTITNTYHQMELGYVTGAGEAVLSPLDSYLPPMSDDVIRWGYGLLDEAFDSSINVYEGVNLWNGADYRVPNNISLTFDMLYNPFIFPYVVDCYEEVVHYTESAQDYTENGLYYDIDLKLEFLVPATVTLTVPTTVRKGQTYSIGVDMALDSDKITIIFAYNISLGLVLHWWFIGIDEAVTYSGRFEFAVSLDDIAEFITSLGLREENFLGDKCGGWLSVTDFSTSTDLLGTMLDAEIKIHMLKIVEDLLGETEVGPLIKLIGFFLDGIDLIASPSIAGEVTGQFIADNSAITLNSTDLLFEEGNTHESILMTVNGGPSVTGLSLSHLQYHTTFATEWDLGLNFTSIVNYFADDTTIHLGTFPSITVSSDEHTINATMSTGYDQMVSLSVINDITPPEVVLSQSPSYPTSSDAVQVNAVVTDQSPMSYVILSYSVNSGATWTNVTMTQDSGKWSASISAQPVGTQVQYKVYAEDGFGNSAVTGIQMYVVQSPTQTSTTGTTSTTSTTTGTGSTTASPSSAGLDPMFLVLGIAAAGGVLAVLVIYMVRRK